jgi:hypothetical protein
MRNSEQSPGLQPKDCTEQRNDALREGVKGLFLANGVGAVALLAFLQAIWSDDPKLAKFVVLGITFMAVGVLLAGLVQFFRYHASFNFQGGHTGTFKVYRFLYLAAAYSSLGVFLGGLLIVVTGAWCVLSQGAA